MLMPTGNLSLPISSTCLTQTAGAASIVAVRLWVELCFPCSAGKTLLRKCLLDSGAPLSVVPLAIHQTYSFVWKPVPGPWPRGFTSWLGVPCAIGEMEVWAPTAPLSGLQGPFKFAAKFALATPAKATAPLPILLGLNFLADHLAETMFQCYAMPQAGSILLP